ncbi:unnamed protein product, partial [Dibothriocephalus latus]
MDKFEAVFNYVTNEANKLFIYTDLNAPMFKVITVDLNDLSRENWKDLIPHDESSLLEQVFCVNKKDLVLCRMKDVTVSVVPFFLLLLLLQVVLPNAVPIYPPPTYGL